MQHEYKFSQDIATNILPYQQRQKGDVSQPHLRLVHAHYDFRKHYPPDVYRKLSHIEFHRYRVHYRLHITLGHLLHSAAKRMALIYNLSLHPDGHYRPAVDTSRIKSDKSGIQITPAHPIAQDSTIAENIPVLR